MGQPVPTKTREVYWPKLGTPGDAPGVWILAEVTLWACSDPSPGPGNARSALALSPSFVCGLGVAWVSARRVADQGDYRVPI